MSENGNELHSNISEKEEENEITIEENETKEKEEDSNENIESKAIDEEKVDTNSEDTISTSETSEDDVEELEENNVSSVKEAEEEISEEQIHYFERNLVEGALYVSGKPLSIEEISTKLEIGKKKVEAFLNELALDYLDRPTALIINQVGETYQMALRTEFVEKVSKFAKGGAIAEKYLRTLTVIALKQPILKSLVVKIRGTGAYEHVKFLIENGLVEGVKKGRSQELTTTDKYAEMFGLPKDKGAMKQMMVAQLGIEDEEEKQKK